jgi:7-cyano-7-deazaguanine reductase
MPKPPKPKGLTLLGRSEGAIPPAPTAQILETFENPARRPYWIRFETADFTSLCPITGQADFAELKIEYLPNRRCLETKSLKFYLASYRNERAFNEAVTNQILDHLVKACAPKEMIVEARFASRGGISLTITAIYPDKPKRIRR